MDPDDQSIEHTTLFAGVVKADLSIENLIQIDSTGKRIFNSFSVGCNSPVFPGSNQTWDGTDGCDEFKLAADDQNKLNNVKLNALAGDDLIDIDVRWTESKGSVLDGGEGFDTVKWRGQYISDTKIDAEVVDVKIIANEDGIKDVTIGGVSCADKVFIEAQQLLDSTIIGKDLHVSALSVGGIDNSLFKGSGADDSILLKTNNQFTNSSVLAGGGNDLIRVEYLYEWGDGKVSNSIFDGGLGNDHIVFDVHKQVGDASTVHGGDGDDKIEYLGSAQWEGNNLDIRLSRSDTKDSIVLSKIPESEGLRFILPKSGDIKLYSGQNTFKLNSNNTKITPKKNLNGTASFSIKYRASNGGDWQHTDVDVTEWPNTSKGIPIVYDQSQTDFISGEDGSPCGSSGEIDKPEEPVKESCPLNVLASDGYVGQQGSNNNKLINAKRFFEAGVSSIRFKSDLERIKGGGDGGEGQGNDYAATVKLIRNDGESVELEGRISWQDQKNDTSMGVHIPNAKQSEQKKLSELFPLLSDYADKLNIIIPDKNRSPESLLDKNQSASISGKANPPSSQYLCEFEPPEVVDPCDVVQGEEIKNLIINGNFEQIEEKTGKQWWQINSLEGWDVKNKAEIWTSGFKGISDFKGGYFYVELDSNKNLDSISQTVETKVGATYTLSFDLHRRRSDDETIRISLNDFSVNSPVSGEWITHQYTFVADANETTLAFSEIESENDSYGGLIDNVSLVEICGNDFEPKKIVKANSVDGAEINPSDENDINKEKNSYLNYSFEFDSPLEQLQILPFEFDFKGSAADEEDVELKKISFLGDRKDNPGIVLDIENKMLTIPSNVTRVDVSVPAFDDALVEETENLVLNIEDKVLSADIYDNDYSDSGININPIEGTGSCGDDEFVFEAQGKPNGMVSFNLKLIEKLSGSEEYIEEPFPEDGKYFYSKTGAPGDWSDNPLDNNQITQLSSRGTGYIKVQLPPLLAEGKSLNAQVTQYDIQLQGDEPIIDVQYQMLHFDGAVPKDNQIPEPNESWTDINEGKIFEKAYTYKDLLPSLRKRQGYSLEADVSLKFNTFLKKFTFDTNQKLEDPNSDDFDYANRFQPRFGDGKDKTQGEQDVSFDFEFYLLNEGSGIRQKVALKNFWVDVVDLDTPHDNPNHEFVSIPGLDLASNEDENSSAAIIYTFPDGEGNPGEQGFVDDQKTDGFKNLIEVENNENQGYTKFLGSPEWNVFHGEKFNVYKFSNHPAGSVLLDYREPVKNLIFNAGTTGKMHSGANPLDNKGDPKEGGSRNLSFSIGNSFTSGDGFKPSGDIQKASASILLDECDILGDVLGVDPEAACLDEDNNKLATFTYTVNVKKSNIDQNYAYEFSSKKVGGYTVLETSSVTGASSEDIAQQNKNGLITVEKGATKFVVTVDVQAEDRLGRNDEMTLTVKSTDSSNDEAGQSGTASLSDEDLENCDPDVLGEVLSVEAEAACVSRGKTTATFTYVVEVEPGNIGQEFDYVFSQGESNEGKYEVVAAAVIGAESRDIIDEKKAEGKIQVEKGTKQFAVQVTVEAAEGERLQGKDELTLSVKPVGLDRDATTATTSLSDEDLENCDPDVLGEVLSVEAEAACVSRGKTTATFTYVVEVEPGNIGQEFDYVFSQGESNEGKYEVVAAAVIGAESRDIIDEKKAEGKIQVEKGTKQFAVQVTVEAAEGERLQGKDELTLSVKPVGLDRDATTATTSLSDEDLENCDPDILGEVERINAAGACIESSNAKIAKFAFDVELNGPINQVDQAYYYRFASNKALEDGYEIDQILVNGERRDLDAEGQFTVPQAGVVSDFSVQVQVSADAVLDGSEALMLTLDNQPDLSGKSPSATAKIKNFDDCGIPGSVESIMPSGACVDDGDLTKATFAFEVKLDSGYNNRGQVFSYRFDANKALADGYEVTAFYVNGEKQDAPSKKGSFEISSNSFKAVSDLKIQVDVQAAGQLDGTEALTLTLDNTFTPAGLTNDSPSAKAVIANFDDCPPDLDQTSEVALYLLMDNSTSMLLPDPSTEESSSANRMEAQARVALYAYQQALADAGYGFSREGSGQVLTSEDFREDVIENSADDLVSALDGFEVITDPDQASSPQPVTVHLISYGYAVDYGKVSFQAGNTAKALTAAKAILDVTTPNELYGNSIKGNSIWKNRDLPKPTADDRFQADGRLTSNLYSGTEMLGALSGLDTLLQDQARNAGDDQPTTLISMVTDGRPERRAWWDTREGLGSDSIIGASIPLPDRLGRDAITTSGLIYDADGNPTFLRDNSGQKVWKQMQRSINQSLDSIAAKSSNPLEALQVEVMAMGESSDANFPAIYADLFGNRTFDNSKGGWSYEVFNSFGLPDFLG
ncbi:DUF642 domain-containing protein [Synechococcus sp. AH-601-P18]|nr:DUF642 domain-containing protein [Synechococcus sp. AH-601-P18]